METMIVCVPGKTDDDASWFVCLRASGRAVSRRFVTMGEAVEWKRAQKGAAK